MGYYKEGDRITSSHSNSENIFKDEHERREKYTADEVREYLLSIVTGTMFPAYAECGKMYVSIEKLKELVEEGYNIVRVLNPEDLTPYKIYIEYQKYDKEDKRNQGYRRRF